MTASPSQTENFGIAARYAPPTFTSRDPLFEKYFWLSPYTYCANNPMKFVDPTGCEKIPWFSKKKDNILKRGVKVYKDNIPNIINIFAHGNGDAGWKNGFLRQLLKI